MLAPAPRYVRPITDAVRLPVAESPSTGLPPGVGHPCVLVAEKSPAGADVPGIQVDPPNRSDFSTTGTSLPSARARIAPTTPAPLPTTRKAVECSQSVNGLPPLCSVLGVAAVSGCRR